MLKHKSKNVNVFKWLQILQVSVRRNGPLQLLFYLSNLDYSRFIEYSKALDYFEKWSKGEFILDIGTGYSVFPFFIQTTLLDKNCQYVTLDLSISACKFQAETNRSNVHQIKCDMTCLPIKSTSVSCIFAISSLEHVPDDVTVFREISRVLKQKATAIISVPYSQKNARTVKMKRNEKMMFLLRRFRGLWLVLLNKHYAYFIEQTATDSIMKYYNDKSLNAVSSKQALDIEETCCWNASFLYLPLGWFILKDLFLGMVLLKIGRSQVGNCDNASGIIFMARKSGTNELVSC